jgi:uncharacterized protein (DUF983 family)
MYKISQENSSHTAAIGKKARLSMMQAMAGCKCPICTEGDMFKTSALNLSRFNELRTECTVCGFKFMPEPGFYQLSLYFTYAVNVGLSIVLGFATYFLFNNPPLWVYYAVIGIPAIIIVPWNLRYSKW